MANHYSFNIEWSEEDQEFVATCPAFPGLLALGSTEEEALSEAKIALEGFIETCIAENVPLPEPHVRGTYSGQFRLRLPKSLHQQASEIAARDEISLNQFVVSALEMRVGVKQFGTRVVDEVKRALSEHAARLQLVVASALTANEQTMTEETVSVTSSSTRTQKVIMGLPRISKGN